MGERQGRVAVRRVVEELQRALVAAVDELDEESLVAARRVGGAEDHEIGGEADETVFVARRVLDVDDALLRLRHGIDREMDAARKTLVGAAAIEDVAVGEGDALGDAQLDMVRHGRNLAHRAGEGNRLASAARSAGYSLPTERGATVAS